MRLTTTAATAAMILALGGCATMATASSADPASAPAIVAPQRIDGLLPIRVDTAGGRVLMELPAPGADGVMARVIHHTALKTGVGSAVTGQDRAQIGPTQILVFRKVGKKIVAEFENVQYRAPAGGADEQAAARDAFLTSTVWAGEPVETLPGGGAVVDLAGFLTRDAHGLVEGLRGAGQGTLRPVADLTLVDPAAARAFPDNVELEARLTFAVDQPGGEVSRIAPDARLITFTVRHSFIRLPDDGYQARRFDPRTGAMNSLFYDFSAPLDEPVVQRLAHRFRLVKTDPTAARSTVVRPIVFYVDRAAPEPIRSALVEGARWWTEAFDRAGYVDAFRVEVLPEGIDPLDARYNVINWVNRSTRSWSYGQSVVDPRTGEIVKGSVLLGSLRVRQDMLIFEGLTGAARTGTGAQDDPQRIALARMRQLSAHEVGHAIGLLHNFAASTQDRASVMDYPVPVIELDGDRMDFSHAYGVGVGDWDRFAIDWLYGDASPAERERRTAEGAARLRFVSDADARSASDAQPWGSLWDNGADPVAELKHLMQVRRIALNRFGLDNLSPGLPVNDLRRRLVPIWLYHRYQVDAAAKLIGGVDYGYPIAGTGRQVAAPVPAADQRAALAALIATLDPAELTLTPSLVALLDAQQSGDNDAQSSIELMQARTGRPFDAGAAAEVAADVTLDALFAPQRLNRLVDGGARGAGNLTLAEALDAVVTSVFRPAPTAVAEAARRVQARTVLSLAEVARGATLSPSAAALVSARLDTLGARLRASTAADTAQRAHDRWLGALLADRERLDQVLSGERFDPPTPPGSPIGAEACWHC